jgi:peptidoglycan hydrolase-like protein with peptidoglycan-binding domain
MNTFSKKVAAVVLTATTIVSLSGLGSFASVASAQSATMTVEQMTALIAQLTAQLSALQGGGNSMGTAACTFTRNLTIGSTGADVSCLQNVLASKGLLTATARGYFGALTKAAVMKWQAMVGVSATGYFGPLSRSAFAAAMSQTPGNGPYVPPITNPGQSLLVTADTSASMPTTVIAGAGQSTIGSFAFTAPASTGVTVTGLSFTKVGVLSDSNVNNMYLADKATGAVVAQFQSLSSGVATFSGMNLNIAAGQTARWELRVDISSSATSGNTIAFDLTGVTTAGGVSVAGLPVRGNVLTVTQVSNPSIAGFTATFNTVGSSVDAGTNQVLVADVTMNVTNSPVDLKSVTMALVGSANKGDIRNLTAKVNGQTVATVPLGADMVVFGFASNPVRLQTGNSSFQVYADIAGSPYRTVQVTSLHPYDWVAMDTQYHQNITATVTNTNATSISIRAGSITVSTASDSPTSQIPKGASGVTLAKFTIYAAGEPVKVKYLDLTLTEAGSSAWSTLANVTDDVSQIRLVTSDGRQIGNTISNVVSGSDNGTCTLAATSITCHFGSSSSNINFVLPANTTTVISAIADIGSATDMTSLSASLPALTSNLEGQVSFNAASSGAASGASRTVSANPLTVAANPALNSPTYINGASNVRIASFVLTASSAQSADLRSITVDWDTSAGSNVATKTLVLQNLKAMVGSTQIGFTQPTVTAAGATYTFSGNSVTVPAGGSIVIDFYADIVSSSNDDTYVSVLDVTGWTANGSISGSSIAFPGAQAGQDVVVSSGPAITVSLGSATAPAQNLVMGSTGNSVYTAHFLNGNIDQVRITDLTITDTIANGSTGKASFDQFTLWDGTTQVAGPVSPTSVSATTSTIAFTLTGSGVIVEKNAAKDLTVKASVPTFTSGGAVSNSSHVFKVFASTDVIAKSVGSPSATVSVTGTGNGTAGNAQKVYRTKLAISATQIVSGAQGRFADQDLAYLNFSADAAYQVFLGTVTLKFSGAPVASGTTAFEVDLVDTNNNITLGEAATDTETCTPTVGDTCSVTFTPQYSIAAGTSKQTKLRVDASAFANPGDSIETLSVRIAATGAVLWSDGTTNNIQLENTVIPFTVANVDYN